jgi:protein SCO1/2
MHRVALILVLAGALLLAACGGGEESAASAPAQEEPATVYQVRGQFVMYQYGGEAIRVDHEEIPGFMKAMRMDFRPKDPAEVEGLEPGDKISFRYVVGEKDEHIEGIEKLPPETELHLAADDTH